MSLSSNRVFYRELKPYDAPSELAELHGPSGGRIELPLTVYWGPAHVFDLQDESDLVEAYQAVIREGRVQDQAVILNPQLLVSIWSELMLPVRVRMLWEGRFGELAAANIPSRQRLLTPARRPGRVYQSR